MTEVIRRDKYVTQLAKLQSTINKSIASATNANICSWLTRLNETWTSLENAHDALMVRAGSSESSTHEKIFEDAKNVQLSLHDMLSDAKGAIIELKDRERKVRQAYLQRAIQNVALYINDNVATLVQCEAEEQRIELESRYTQLEEIRLQRILEGKPEEEVFAQEREIDQIYRKTTHLLATVRTEAQIAANAAANVVAPAQIRDDINIPSLQISPFDGRLETWEAFRDCFSQGVHRRQNISGVHKLQYLKSLVKGDAEESVRNFALTDDNYVAAWTLLNERYDRRRDLVFSHMRTITTEPKCDESADSLRRLMNKTASAVLALHNLGRPTQQYSDWIVFLLVEKLDNESRRMWEQTLVTHNEVPTWTDLEAFLNGRVRSISALSMGASSSSSTSKSGGRNFKNAQSYRVSSDETTTSLVECAKIVCPYCNGAHLIQFCETFRTLSVEQRRAMAADRRMCFVCLDHGHHASNCQCTRSCQICSARHNTMLHKAVEPQSSLTEQTVTANSANAIGDRRNHRQVLLATALVIVHDYDGQRHELRALLDPGSEGQ